MVRRRARPQSTASEFSLNSYESWGYVASSGFDDAARWRRSSDLTPYFRRRRRADSVRAFLALRNDIAGEASEAGMTEETIDALLSDD